MTAGTRPSRPKVTRSAAASPRSGRALDHGCAKRWQVRWRDDNGKQCKRNFDKKGGTDPEKSADAFDAKIQAELDAGTYVDPLAGKITFRAYADQWLAAQTFDEGTRDSIEQRLRLHVYPDLGDKQWAARHETSRFQNHSGFCSRST